MTTGSCVRTLTGRVRRPPKKGGGERGRVGGQARGVGGKIKRKNDVLVLWHKCSSPRHRFTVLDRLVNPLSSTDRVRPVPYSCGDRSVSLPGRSRTTRDQFMTSRFYSSGPRGPLASSSTVEGLFTGHRETGSSSRAPVIVSYRRPSTGFLVSWC